MDPLGKRLQGLGAWMSGDGVRYENMRIFEQDQKDRAEQSRQLQQQRISEAQRERLADLGRNIAGGLAQASQQGPAALAAVLPSAFEQARGTPWEQGVRETAQKLQAGDFESLQQELQFDANALGAGLDTNRGVQGSATFFFEKDGVPHVGRQLLDTTSGTTRISSNPVDGTMLNNIGLSSEGRVQEAGAKTAAQEQAKSGEELYVDIRTRGLEAARAMPTIKRSMEILGTVKTGGLEAAKLKAKQFFGFESADEASLTNLLGKAVLSQLRDTFGAQFTAQEGEQLKQIEAGLGKSTAGNRRILADLMTMNQKKIARAVSAARQRGDTLALDEIKDFATMELGPYGVDDSSQSPTIVDWDSM